MSLIKFKKINWDNMFSYGKDNEIDLSSHTLTQIVGENGAGKSSIPNILEEGLYNKNSKGFKKAAIPNRWINEPYSVTIEFQIEEKEYLLVVKKASTLKVTLLEDGEDISANTGTGTFKIVEDIIGMPFKLFAQLVYQNTDSSLQFLTATDSKRKEFLIQLFDMTNYTEKYSVFSDALKDVSKQATYIEGRIDTLRSSLKSSEKDANIEINDEVQEVPEFPEELVTEKANIETQLKNVNSENHKIEKSNKALESLNKLRDRETIEEEISAIEIEDKTPLMEVLGRQNAEIKSAKAVLQKIEGLSGQCPTCLQEVDEDFTNTLVSENQKIIDSNREEAKKTVEKIEKIKSKESQLARLERELKDRSQAESGIIFEEYKETLTVGDVSNQLVSIQEKIKDAKATIENINSHNSRVNRLLAQKEAAEGKLEELQSEFEEVCKDFDELDSKKGPLETLKKAFSGTGLVAYKLENKVIDLESYTNEYLSELSDGQFNLTFELEKDKLNVVIYDNGEPVEITSLSSGEKARVVIGTLLGIRKVMQSIAKQTVNILFLDEVISVMDDAGKERLVEVLLEEKELNTFLVSHSWSHPLVHKLEVVKNDRISEIQ